MAADEQLSAAWLAGQQQAAAQLQLARRSHSAQAGMHGAAAGLQPSSAGLLIAEGDSWFDYSVFTSILDLLEDEHGFAIEEVAAPGEGIGAMAYRDDQLARFIRRMRKCMIRNEVPRAILLSGGGNELAGSALEVLLSHHGSADAGLNQPMVSALIDEQIWLAFGHIISSITSVCTLLVGRVVPIVIHGYDYPVPDGRGVLCGRGGWLKPAFEHKGYAELAANKLIVRELIDRLNLMLSRLCTQAGAEHVHYVDLRNTLSSAEVTYRRHWGDELHPSKRGFVLLTNKLADAINTLPVV